MGRSPSSPAVTQEWDWRQPSCSRAKVQRSSSPVAIGRRSILRLLGHQREQPPRQRYTRSPAATAVQDFEVAILRLIARRLYAE